MVLIIDDSWDSPDPWQKQGEHSQVEFSLTPTGLSLQMFSLLSLPHWWCQPTPPWHTSCALSGLWELLPQLCNLSVSSFSDSHMWSPAWLPCSSHSQVENHLNMQSPHERILFLKTFCLPRWRNWTTDRLKVFGRVTRQLNVRSWACGLISWLLRNEEQIGY